MSAVPEGSGAHGRVMAALAWCEVAEGQPAEVALLAVVKVVGRTRTEAAEAVGGRAAAAGTKAVEHGPKHPRRVARASEPVLGLPEQGVPPVPLELEVAVALEAVEAMAVASAVPEGGAAAAAGPASLASAAEAGLGRTGFSRGAQVAGQAARGVGVTVVRAVWPRPALPVVAVGAAGRAVAAESSPAGATLWELGPGRHPGTGCPVQVLGSERASTARVLLAAKGVAVGVSRDVVEGRQAPGPAVEARAVAAHGVASGATGSALAGR